MNKIFFITIFALAFSCGEQKVRRDNQQNALSTGKAVAKSIGYFLKKKTGAPIGNVYTHMINDSIFTRLYVLAAKDTLYKIEGPLFFNVNGKDIEVSGNNFYGYCFVLKKIDYFVIRLYGDSGRTVSDNITVEWNQDAGVLEVQKTP